MKNKKTVLLILLMIGLVGIIFIFPRKIINKSRTISAMISPTQKVDKPQVTLTINNSQKTTTYSGVLADNAFMALSVVAAQNNIKVVTKQYDFGVFVSQIGDQVSAKDMAWVYYINGKSGEVAADKAALKTGDSVEWRYAEPIY
jgi:hypothetical protein